MNVKQCPICKKYDAHYGALGPQARNENTEIWLAAYCPDCGYSWWVIYTPDQTESRE